MVVVSAEGRRVLQEEYAVVGGGARENYLGDGLSPRLRRDHPRAAFTWKGNTERDEDDVPEKKRRCV